MRWCFIVAYNGKICRVLLTPEIRQKNTAERAERERLRPRRRPWQRGATSRTIRARWFLRGAAMPPKGVPGGGRAGRGCRAVRGKGGPHPRACGRRAPNGRGGMGQGASNALCAIRHSRLKMPIMLKRSVWRLAPLNIINHFYRRARGGRCVLAQGAKCRARAPGKAAERLIYRTGAVRERECPRQWAQ